MTAIKLIRDLSTAIHAGIISADCPLKMIITDSDGVQPVVGSQFYKLEFNYENEPVLYGDCSKRPD